MRIMKRHQLAEAVRGMNARNVRVYRQRRIKQYEREMGAASQTTELRKALDDELAHLDEFLNNAVKKERR